MSNTALLNVLPPWCDLVETLTAQHNGIMSIELHFGHEGSKTCLFRDYDKVLAEHSAPTIRTAVYGCYSRWRLEKYADFAATHGDTDDMCSTCLRPKWTHEHPNFYGACPASEHTNADR